MAAQLEPECIASYSEPEIRGWTAEADEDDTGYFSDELIAIVE